MFASETHFIIRLRGPAIIIQFISILDSKVPRYSEVSTPSPPNTDGINKSCFPVSSICWPHKHIGVRPEGLKPLSLRTQMYVPAARILHKTVYRISMRLRSELDRKRQRQTKTHPANNFSFPISHTSLTLTFVLLHTKLISAQTESQFASREFGHKST